MGAPAPLPDLRPRRLLRLLAEPARPGPLRGHRPPGRRLRRAARALGLVLRRFGPPAARPLTPSPRFFAKTTRGFSRKTPRGFSRKTAGARPRLGADVRD